MNTTQRNNWDALSMKEKAAMMKVAVQNGIYNLDDIRQAYNEFAEGGHKGNTFEIGGDIEDEYYAGTLPEIEISTPSVDKYIAQPSSTYTAPYISEFPDIRFIGSRYDRDTLIDKGGKPADDISYKERWERQKREKTIQDWKDLYNGLQRTVGTSIAGANLFTGGPWAAIRLSNGNKASTAGQLFSKYLLATNALDNYNDAVDLVVNPSISGAVDLATGLALSRYRDFGSRARQFGELVGQGVNVYNTVDNYKSLGGPLVQIANRYEDGGNTNGGTNIVDWIIGEEGFNTKPEDIGDGKTTLGSGLTNPKWHKMYYKKGTWTEEDNRAAVAEEVENRRRWAEKNIPNWNELPADSQNALLSYKYNYDFTPKNSPLMFQALRDKDYEEAARQIDATSSNPKFKKGLQARRQREQELFMKGINSVNVPQQPEVVEAVPTVEEAVYTPPQRVLDNIAANNGRYMITGTPPLAGPRNTVLNALRRLKELNLFAGGGPLVDLANSNHFF